MTHGRFPCDALLVVHAAAEHDMVTLGAVGELGRDETEVAAVVLGAGMRTAGEVDVERRGVAGRVARRFCNATAWPWYRRKNTCSLCCPCRR